MGTWITQDAIKVTRGTIERIVEERFGGQVEFVSVIPAQDSDGDPIIKITVVLRDGVTKLDRRKMVGLARHLRSGINDVDAFPLINFVSKQDAKKLHVAAA